MISGGPKNHYLEIYHELNKSLVIAKKLVEPSLSLKIKVQNLIKEITEIRKELDRIFSHPVFYQTCNQCHKKSEGGCCKRRDSYLTVRDGIYIVSQNIEFQFPQPDTKFLLSLDKIRCLFLSEGGCLLHENRPITCLNEVCDDLRTGEQKLMDTRFLSKRQIDKLLYGLSAKTDLLFGHIISKNKIYLFRHLSSQKLIMMTSWINKIPVKLDRDLFCAPRPN